LASAQFDEHPPDPGRGPMGNVTTGMQWTVDQVNAIVKGGLWPRVAIFVTWDCWGGWYDHVNPPNVEAWKLGTPQPSYKGTQFRYGSRVGCLVLSPFARDQATFRRSYTRTSVSSVSANPFSDCPR